MTFPLMPFARPPQFVRGAITQADFMTTQPSGRTVTLGNPSEDRWVVVMATGNSGGTIGTWTTYPTINGVTMTQVVQDGATGGNDGQRGAIWVTKLTQGTTCSLTSALASFSRMWVFTLTGVRNPATGYVTRTGSGTLTTTAPACALFYSVPNFGSLTSVTNMTILNSDTCAINPRTTANTTTYTITGSSLFLNRFVSWSFDY